MFNKSISVHLLKYVLFKMGDSFAYLSLAQPQQVLGPVQHGGSQRPAWPGWLAALTWIQVDQVSVLTQRWFFLLLHKSVDTTGYKAKQKELSSQCNCTGLYVQLQRLCYPARPPKNRWGRGLKAVYSLDLGQSSGITE